MLSLQLSISFVKAGTSYSTLQVWCASLLHSTFTYFRCSTAYDTVLLTFDPFGVLRLNPEGVKFE